MWVKRVVAWVAGKRRPVGAGDGGIITEDAEGDGKEGWALGSASGQRPHFQGCPSVRRMSRQHQKRTELNHRAIESDSLNPG